MRKYYLILAIFLSLTSQISSQNWFPLEDGNTWQLAFRFSYNIAGWYYIEFEIVEYSSNIDTIINTNEYYILNNNSLFRNNQFTYNKIDNKLYLRYQDSDYVFMDFNLNNGEEFLHMNVYNELTNAIVEEGQISLLDSTLTYKGCSDNYYTYLFAEGIGLIKRIYGSARYEIIQAVLYDSSEYRVIQDKTLPYAQLDSNYVARDLTNSFTVTIDHKFSVKSVNEPGWTVSGDSYIDTARIEVCYQNADTTIVVGEQSMFHSDEISFNTFLTLDPTLIYSHYDFCYRIWAKDRGLIPREAITPITGRAKIRYRTNISSYYPLQRFNRWVFDKYILHPNGESTYTGTVGYWIGKDTLLVDGNIYKPFISILGDAIHFERIDSVNAVVHKLSDQGTEALLDSLTATVGDTVLSNRLSNNNRVIFESITNDNSFGILSYVQKYRSVNNPESYYKIKDERGLLELREAPTDSTIGFLLKLKGVIIKFFVYGDTTLTNVVENERTTKTFALNQNYPNPFNPTTIISYNLPEVLQTNLTVFDILGNQVSVLVDEEQNAGYYELEFDGTNLASGIYLYKLNAGLFSKTNKMILIR